MEKEREGLDPLSSKAVGRVLSAVPRVLSVRTTARGTPSVAIAIMAPNTEIEGLLKPKELSSSNKKASGLEEPIGGSSLSDTGLETSTGSGSMQTWVTTG